MHWPNSSIYKTKPRFKVIIELLDRMAFTFREIFSSLLRPFLRLYICSADGMVYNVSHLRASSFFFSILFFLSPPTAFILFLPPSLSLLVITLTPLFLPFSTLISPHLPSPLVRPFSFPVTGILTLTRSRFLLCRIQDTDLIFFTRN